MQKKNHDNCRMETSLLLADMGDMGHPGGIRTRGGELSLQEIRDEHRRLADGPTAHAIPMQRAQVVLAHQASDAMLTTGFSRLSQIEEDAGSAIDAVTRDKRRANESKQ